MIFVDLLATLFEEFGAFVKRDSGWDPLHRLINDMKHGMAFGPKEISNRLQTALLSSTYLFNLNYKPFKGGSFHADKKELLQHFMATTSEERSFILQLCHVCSQFFDLILGNLDMRVNKPTPLFLHCSLAQDSDLFSEYAVLISMDFKQQIRTAEDFRDLWSSLASELESFRLKKSLVKSGRWFSWHTAAEEHMNEWHALQMLLRHQFPDMDHPDKTDKKSFKDLRNDSGGLKLALKCTTFQNWLGVQVLMLGGRPMWNWWSKTIREIKSPQDGLRNFITMSSTWRSDLQLQELAGCLQNAVEIKRVAQYCAVAGCSPEDFAKQLWYYVVGLLCYRVGSLSKHECAPYCFAPILGPEGVASHAAGEMMLGDWKTLCILEQAASPGAADLAMEMRNCIYPPMRLAFNLLETGDRPGALQLLRAMLETFPDTKLIEDCHQRIRCDSLQNPNRRHTTSEVQSIVVGSQVLEARGICHPAAVTKRAFMSKWKTTKATKMRSKFHCANEKLPEQFARIMGKKTWPTLSPESLIRAAGAWMWAREYITNSLKRCNVGLTVSRHFSTVFLPARWTSLDFNK